MKSPSATAVSAASSARRSSWSSPVAARRGSICGRADRPLFGGSLGWRRHDALFEPPVRDASPSTARRVLAPGNGDGGSTSRASAWLAGPHLGYRRRRGRGVGGDYTRVTACGRSPPRPDERNTRVDACRGKGLDSRASLFSRLRPRAAPVRSKGMFIRQFRLLALFLCDPACSDRPRAGRHHARRSRHAAAARRHLL